MNLLNRGLVSVVIYFLRIANDCEITATIGCKHMTRRGRTLLIVKLIKKVFNKNSFYTSIGKQMFCSFK